VSLLQEKKIDYTIIEYIKHPLKKSEILSLSKKLGKAPGEFVRRGEADFKNNLCETDLHNDEKIAEAMSRFPKLIERPILVKDNRGVVGRPLENILNLLSEKE